MKRNIKIFFGLIIGAILLKSCFVDNGNYDYKDILVNKITITYPAYTFNTYIGEPVVFTPVLRYANTEQADTNIYKWEYHFNEYGLVCSERNMNVVFDDAVVGKTYDGIVMATDTTTGAVYTQNISFRYNSRYTVGWLILSDAGGQSKLNLVRELNGEWFADSDIYKTLHKGELGSNPGRLIINRSGRNEVRIIQDGPAGSIILDGLTYKVIGKFSDEFVGNKYPEGFKPKFMLAGGNLAAMQGEDGRVFTKTYRGSGTSTYAYDFYVNVPLQLNNKVLNVQYLLGSSGIYSSVLYDKGAGCFYMLYGASYTTAGKLYGLKPPAGWSPDSGLPSPDDLNAYDIIYCQMKSPSSYQTDIHSVLKEKSTGLLYMYSFEYSSSGSNTYVKNIIFRQIPATVASLMDEGTKFHMLRGRPYMFFVPGNDPQKLYYYDPRTTMHKLFKGDFPSPITSIESNYSTNNSIGVGLENGKFYLLDVSEAVFIGGTEEDKIIFETPFSGKVVDLFYKAS